MLYGIDIASHEKDIDLSKLEIDFVIVKATEGATYLNPYFHKKMKQGIKLGLCVGFYHYGRNNDAIKEADWLLANTADYRGIAIPVLDWEEDQSVSWVNKFVRRYHEKTGVWPWIYANPWRFNQGGVEKEADRWIAQYPNVLHPDLSYDPGNIPDTDGLVACWQYASDGRISGYAGNLDLNHFYGSKDQWYKYAKSDPNAVAPGSDSTAPAHSTLENDEYKVTIERK